MGLAFHNCGRRSKPVEIQNSPPPRSYLRSVFQSKDEPEQNGEAEDDISFLRVCGEEFSSGLASRGMEREARGRAFESSNT